jgi:hypothetical protein
VLGSDEEGDVGWFQRALEELDLTSIAELEIGLERGFANRTGSIDRRQEADLVVRLGCVPFAKALDVNVFCITRTLAGRNHWVLIGIFFIKAHVAHRMIAERISVRSMSLVAIHRIIRVFCCNRAFGQSDKRKHKARGTASKESNLSNRDV